MRDYVIMTDSCCDLTAQLADELGIVVLPLTLLMDGQEYRNYLDGREIAPKDFYNRIRSGSIPTTSAINVGEFEETMRPILAEGKDLIYLAFSSGLSTTYQSAVIAGKELQEVYPDRKIYVIDSLCAAVGLGLLIHTAAGLRDQGKTLEEVAAWVEENKGSMAHWVTVDDLNHLKRGGRVSATTAFVGGLLGIKPIIHVDDNGKLDTVAKVRGRKAAMEYLVDKVRTTAKDLDTVFIAHGDCADDARKLEEKLKEIGVKEVTIGYVGGVVGAHTGPGVLVVFFLATER